MTSSTFNCVVFPQIHPSRLPSLRLPVVYDTCLSYSSSLYRPLCLVHCPTNNTYPSMMDLQIGTRQIIPVSTGITSQFSNNPHSPSTSSASSSVTLGDRSTAPTSTSLSATSPSPKTDTSFTSSQPAPSLAKPIDLSRRADDVIARLTSSTSSASGPEQPEDIHRRANDVISRIETEARAREVIERLEKQTQQPVMVPGPGMMPLVRPFFGVMPGMMMPQMMMGPGGMLIPVGTMIPGMRMGFPPQGQVWRPAPLGPSVTVVRPPVRPGPPPTSSTFSLRASVAPTLSASPSTSTLTSMPPTPSAGPPTSAIFRPSVALPNHLSGHGVLSPPAQSLVSGGLGPSHVEYLVQNPSPTPSTPKSTSPHVPQSANDSRAPISRSPVDSFHSSFYPRTPSITSFLPQQPTSTRKPDNQAYPSQPYHSPSPITSQPPRPNPQNQIYLGSLPPSTTLQALRTAFSVLSPIVSIELRPPYAMIEFEIFEAADRAVEAYDEGSFCGAMIRVERAVGKASGGRECVSPPPGPKRPSSDGARTDSASKRAR